VQKRSHKQLASALLQSHQGFECRKYEWAFLLGSFSPDCNPFTYLRGFRRTSWFGGHTFSHSKNYILSRIRTLQEKTHWRTQDYYTLGMLTHYLADAFTYPHNETFSESLAAHHVYERDLRLYFRSHLPQFEMIQGEFVENVADTLERLHLQYLTAKSNFSRDTRYILQATSLLMASCLPVIS